MAEKTTPLEVAAIRQRAEQARRPDGRSFHDNPDARGPLFGWPRGRVIWSCDASKGPLLTRWFLFQTRWVGLYLHRLHASDEDRALHDHPWSFVTFLLSSGYWEWTPWLRTTDRPQWRRRFSVLYRSAEWKHRLELVRPTWTLILRFRRRRMWGFWTKTGWLDWQAYGKQWCD